MSACQYFSFSAFRFNFSVLIPSYILLPVVCLALVFSSGAATFSVVNTNDTGAGSFRQALLNANASATTNTITFNVPITGSGPFVLYPQSAYPSVTPYPLIIDGTTQPGYNNRPLVQIDGTGLGANADGLQLLAGACAVRGLAIYRCKRDGIRIQGPGGTNIIQGNYLGTDTTGTNALGNVEGGIYVYRSSGNLIGGTNVAARNVISGGNRNGVYLDDSSQPAAGTGNVVAGNYIGIAADGSRPLGNTNNGVYIYTAPGNLIGGAAAGSGNVISGNAISGVYLFGTGSTSNVIQGNLIGTDATGSLVVSNGVDGVTINGVPGNTVGGAGGARNVISGNRSRGVLIVNSGAVSNLVLNNYLGTDLTGRSALANHTNGVAISGTSGNTVYGNLISGNLQSGVLLIQSGANNNWVAGNWIGPDATGTNALGNSFNGVSVDGVSGNRIGGTNAGDGNLISGNLQSGVSLSNPGGGTNLIQGNWIGTDSTGLRALANAGAGIWITVPGNVIGGAATNARNLISGNSQSGIFLQSAAASNNVVQGNWLGTDVSGAAALGNGLLGTYSAISLSNAPNNLIGGPVPAVGNVISASGDKGIVLNGAGAVSNAIQGNLIGTDASGAVALANQNGGIYIFDASSNLIGGTLGAGGNVISGNGADGLYVSGGNGNWIVGNFIGTDADGVSALGNLWHGIEFLNAAGGNRVGGTAPENDNVIAYARTAGYDGIRVRAGCLGNFISRNSIFSNGSRSATGLGIDNGADGVTTTGLPNLTVAFSGTGTVVAGNFQNTAKHPFLIQLYANAVTNVSGYGEGQVYLGSTNVTTDNSGAGAFVLSWAGTLPAGWDVSATLTDSTNNTTEFASDVPVRSLPVLGFLTTNLFNVTTNSKKHILVTNVYAQVTGVTWPTNPVNFTVSQTTNLADPTSWMPVTNATTVVTGTNRIVFQNLPPYMFYRLQF